MSPSEMAWRGTDLARQTGWSRRQVLPGSTAALPRGLRDQREFPTPLPAEARGLVTPRARAAVVSAADRLLSGDWVVLGTPHPDILDPDWFFDPVTRHRAPQDVLAFRVDHRDESQTGNVKSVWELSRHHHLTVLATAWWLTGEDAYVEVVADQLRSWWAANPFLSGVHWTSGIELGVRLVSWAWIRRLLDEWPKVGELFDDNPDALRQIWWHQRFLSAFRSRGSSANNHVLAEACGRLVAACAFPWYAESDAWRRDASRQLQRELRANTFDSGVNRELATDYHRFATELGLVAATEATASGHVLETSTWRLLAASLDAAAAMVDSQGRPPRQGDGDEGRALVLDDPEGGDSWAQMLSLGAGLIGALPWWPAVTDTVAGAVATALSPSKPKLRGRPARRPRTFPDAGMTLLTASLRNAAEIWCRCDGGPHGFLSIAAHAHADALAVEVRYEGVEVLVDPGTYCYHGEPEWRSYFRSTLAHNTIEVDGVNQSVEGGPFLWSAHAESRVTATSLAGTGPQVWAGHHTGYARLDAPVRHDRKVTLDPGSGELSILDVLTGDSRHVTRLAFHLGPEVSVELSDNLAVLSWPHQSGFVTASLQLPPELGWTAHRGETDPILGWYSPRFGHRVACTTLVGAGAFSGMLVLRTGLVFGCGEET